MTTPADDPVRRRRARIERLVRLAKRLGYALVGVAVVIFFAGLVVDFNAAVASVVIAALVAGCVLLAPAIVVGYGVRAAEREDRQRQA